MPKKKTIHKTVVTVTVLSEDPYEFDSFEQLIYDIVEGDCSGEAEVTSTTVLTGKEAADAVMEQASDPDFFQMDENGNELED